jgi:hypothetical protein
MGYGDLTTKWRFTMAVQMTKADVEVFAEKLEKFAQTLTREERTLLGSILARAADQTAEVQGYTAIEVNYLGMILAFAETFYGPGTGR